MRVLDRYCIPGMQNGMSTQCKADFGSNALQHIKSLMRASALGMLISACNTLGAFGLLLVCCFLPFCGPTGANTWCETGRQLASVYQIREARRSEAT